MLTRKCFRDSWTDRPSTVLGFSSETIVKAFDIVTSDYFPDVICINSTFWDISRWNEDGKDLDKDGRAFYPMLEQNVQNLTKHVNKRALDALKK